jgi:glycosyltransferase involved in cell wall biosynthesis
MRILLIGNFLSSVTGTPGVSEDLAERLSDRGWKVVVASKEVGRFAKLKDILFTIWFRRSEYEIVNVELYSGLAFGLAEISCLTLKAAKKTYLLTLHGGNLPAFARRWPERVRRLLNGASAVIAPSCYLQEEMSLYREDIILIPNPLNIKNYPFSLRSVSKPHLVWLRSFHNIYNPQMAPKVIADLYPSYPEISITMIGPDKGDGALQETQILIEKLGLQKKIEIVPGILKSEVPAYLEKADIFINTTNVDNTPVSVLEAMACGLCIVSTKVGGIPYLLEDGTDALFVPPDNSEAMASAIRRILTEPGLAEKLSMNARKKAQQFDWSVILPQWERLFDAVIKTND